MANETTEPKPGETTEATKEQEPTPERTVPVSALKKQATDFQAKLDEQAAVIAAHRAEAEAEKQAKLAEQGKFEELANAKIAEADAKVAEAQAKLAEKTAEARIGTLKGELAGLEKFTMDGVIASCPPDADPVEWATQFKTDNAAMWAKPGTPPASTPAQGSPSGGTPPKTLEERVAAGEATSDEMKQHLANIT